MQVQQIKRPNNIHLSYMHVQPQSVNDQRPGVTFLPGFKSDMMGSKACFLDNWCTEKGIEYVRFDYGGHGQSGGIFTDGTIGQWYDDAVYVIENIAQKPQILVGSSMGGWISLLIAVRRPDLVAGLVLIAPAPDFTQQILEMIHTDGQADLLEEQGYIEKPSGYEEPYVFTKKLLTEGRNHLLLDHEIRYDGPVRILQGKQDASVPWETAERIQAALSSEDVIVNLIGEGDHSLSRPQDLELLASRIEELL